jgi:hypothetical protein
MLFKLAFSMRLHQTCFTGYFSRLLFCTTGLLLVLQGVNPQEGFTQTDSYFGFTFGIGFTNQTYSNIPGYIFAISRQDTLRTSSGGGFSRKGIAFCFFYESALSPKTSLLLGAGFAQRGFLADSRFNPASGLVTPLRENQTENNRLDYLTFEAAVRFRLTKATRLLPFLTAGNRVLCLTGLQTPFWGTRSGKYGNYSQFEYAPYFSAGLEVPLRGVLVHRRFARSAVLEYDRLLLEAEYSPGIMNVHSAKRGYQAGPAFFQMQRILHNQALTLKAGIRI